MRSAVSRVRRERYGIGDEHTTCDWRHVGDCGRPTYRLQASKHRNSARCTPKRHHNSRSWHFVRFHSLSHAALQALRDILQLRERCETVDAHTSLRTGLHAARERIGPAVRNDAPRSHVPLEANGQGDGPRRPVQRADRVVAERRSARLRSVHAKLRFIFRWVFVKKDEQRRGGDRIVLTVQHVQTTAKHGHRLARSHGPSDGAVST
mmetsp:Transcript_1935/g.5194  ORF Transcript_1935/g.5194 Transcript_1935/m.5194 type:complete len:207 (-) Transcript_1935:521-1141(-)